MERTGRRLAAAVTALAAGLLAAAPAQAGDDSHEDVIIYINSQPRGWEQPNPDDPCRVLIELSAPVAEEWSVLVTTIDGTAVAPGDYLAIAERVAVPAGGRSVAVPIELVADRLVEPPEWFTVEISEPSFGRIGNDRVEIMIEDGAPPGS
jgi:hypothetical protein